MTITSEKAALCRKVRHLFYASHHLNLSGGESEEATALTLERRAHSLWVESGEDDMNTFYLWEKVTDIVLGLESGTITATF